MGQKFTQAKLNVQPEVETFLLKYLPQLQFYKGLNENESNFLKTSLVANEFDGEPLVCKIYFKRDFTEEESKLYLKFVNTLIEIRDLFNIRISPNVAPIILVNDNLQKAGLILRQFYSYNLKERIASMPYLTKIEKKWISFQILCGLSQIHNKGMCHGDIKLENVVLSSIGSVLLCDMAPYKPAYIQQDDVGSFTYYFGTNSSIKSCYLAPERLVDKYNLYELTNSLYKVTTSMDIFSVGAVITELFLEDMLFDHPKLLLYKNGKLNLEAILKKLNDKKLEEILLKMMKVNPLERIDLGECIKFFAEEVCPISISRMLIHFNTLIVSSSYWKSDNRICLIYKHWKQIWKVIYGPESEVPELYHNPNHHVLNQLILDRPFTKYYADNYSVIFDLQNDNLLLEETSLSLDFKANNNSDCSLIVIHLILSAILNAKYSSSKIVAMEILRIFSKRLPDLTKIQYVIPYLVKLLKDANNIVRLTALQEIITILSMINDNELILSSSDYNFFDAYIFPSILELYYSNEPSLVLAFANVIDILTDLEQKFLHITLRSRLNNIKNQNDKGMTNLELKPSFSFNSMNANKDRGEEIIHIYDTDLFEFKSTLFKIIEDILSKNEDIDIQQTLIRKLPNLMLFYGRRETNNFSKFIIAHFNKKDWLIQREILKSIPSLIVTLGETALNQFIVPCMEMIINNNLVELKIYEMIHTMHLLLKMEYLETFRGIDLFKKILPYVMHPNIWIRNEVINFANTLINLLPQGEVYTYLRPDMKNYLYMPFIIMTTELLKQGTKERLSRVIYLLESKEINYFLQRSAEDEEAFHFLENIIHTGRESQKYLDEPNNPLEAQLVRLRVSLEAINASINVKKEFLRFIKYYNYNKEDIRFLERTFLGKLISLSNMVQTVSLPTLGNRKDSVNANLSLQADIMLTQENFKIKFLFKALDIILKEEILEELDSEINQSNVMNVNTNNSNNNMNLQGAANNNLRSTNASFNSKTGSQNLMANWKPQGKLINTLYENESSNLVHSSNGSSIEKLLNLNIDNGNKFLSFASEGQIILWDVLSNENDVSVEKVASSRTSNLGISYNKAICNVDANQFAVASKENIEIFRIDSGKSNFYIQNSFEINSNGNDSDICCMIGNSGNTSQNNNQLIYCNQKGKLQIYDLRVNKPALNFNFGVQRGLISCVDQDKNQQSLYFGTLGGYIINYDFRLNSVITTYKYNENTPIIGLQSYSPCKGKEFDMYSMNLNPNNNNYLLIWTAANDHELGLWNMNTLNCDVIMKVNPLQGKEIIPLPIEIPVLNKENAYKKDDKYNLEVLCNKHLCGFGNPSYRNLLNNVINSDFYSHSNKRLGKLSNLFDISNTVQVAISPINIKIGDNVNNYFNENVPFIISAGNDQTIRYWDITKESLYGTGSNNNQTIKRSSYLINAPNKVDYCIFTTSTYDSTIILQSNETTNSKIPKKDIVNFSEYQNYNGVNFHLGVQNEFDPNLEVLKYCTKVSDVSHKNVISDLITLNVSKLNQTLLISSSWDGSIKIWK